MVVIKPVGRPGLQLLKVENGVLACDIVINSIWLLSWFWLWLSLWNCHQRHYDVYHDHYCLPAHPHQSSPVLYIDMKYRLSIYRHFWTILEILISIRTILKISILISISIRPFWKISISIRTILEISISISIRTILKISISIRTILKISILISISIRKFWKYWYR